MEVAIREKTTLSLESVVSIFNLPLCFFFLMTNMTALNRRRRKCRRQKKPVTGTHDVIDEDNGSNFDIDIDTSDDMINITLILTTTRIPQH
jgi:hypothetical protein